MNFKFSEKTQWIFGALLNFETSLIVNLALESLAVTSRCTPSGIMHLNTACQQTFKNQELRAEMLDHEIEHNGKQVGATTATTRLF